MTVMTSPGWMKFLAMVHNPLVARTTTLRFTGADVAAISCRTASMAAASSASLFNHNSRSSMWTRTAALARAYRNV